MLEPYGPVTCPHSKVKNYTNPKQYPNVGSFWVNSFGTAIYEILDVKCNRPLEIRHGESKIPIQGVDLCDVVVFLKVRFTNKLSLSDLVSTYSQVRLQTFDGCYFYKNAFGPRQPDAHFFPLDLLKLGQTFQSLNNFIKDNFDVD